MGKHWRVVRFGLIPVMAVLVLVTTGVVMAIQQQDPFELDSNAVDNPGGGVDWANIYAPQTGAAVGHSGFFVDVSGPNADSIFMGGGSKDISAISQWRHEAGNVPDKDDILDAYVAAYTANGSLTIYFGADRFANNGNAQIGIWFFQDQVELLPGGTFKGSHTDKDILVLSNFTGGGNNSNIQVYRWNGQADPANPLLLLAEATAEGALSVCTGDDLACAFTNAGGEASPWPYSPKAGPAGVFPTASFFEGGVDIGALLGPQGMGCYSTFLMETRSSQEPTAQLKDLVIGSLDLCGLAVTLTGDEASKIGDPVTYSVTIENTGLVTLYRQEILDSVMGTLSSLASEAGCDTLAPGQSCQFSVDYTVRAGDPDPLLSTLTATYKTGSGSAVSAGDKHNTNLFQPSIAFANLGSAAAVIAGDKVSYTLTLQNTSSADSPNLTCTITDSQLDIQETVNLAPGAQYVVSAAYTTGTSDPTPLVNVASVHCQVDGFPNILEASGEFAVTIGAVPPTAIPTSQESTAVPSATPTPLPVEAESIQEEALNNLTGQGCSPGFWQGGYGRWLWNDTNDPNWKGQGTNPFTHETAFNTIFEAHSAADGIEMYSFVRRGGGPWAWRKAARNVVAGYLNASYGMKYPFTSQEIAQMWADAVGGATTFQEVHNLLGAANNLGCPIGD